MHAMMNAPITDEASGRFHLLRLVHCHDFLSLRISFFATNGKRLPYATRS
jgi:hypothetical protein